MDQLQESPNTVFISVKVAQWHRKGKKTKKTDLTHGACTLEISKNDLIMRHSFSLVIRMLSDRKDQILMTKQVISGGHGRRGKVSLGPCASHDIITWFGHRICVEACHSSSLLVSYTGPNDVNVAVCLLNVLLR